MQPYQAFTTLLRLQVLGSDGRPEADVLITFYPSFGSPAVEFSRPDSTAKYWAYYDSTDANGIITARVWASYGAGAARAEVFLGNLEMTDTLEFPVLPGPAAGVSLMPADTAMQVGRTTTLRAAVVDEWGNARPEVATLGYPTPAVVTGTGDGVVTGSSVGRGMVIARHGGNADTSMVSVVPQGRIAAVREWENTGQSEEILLLDSDGSNPTELRSRPFFCNRRIGPDWDPTGNRLTFSDPADCRGPETVYDLAATGILDAILTPPALAGDHALWPSWSSDGQWIYFARNLGSDTFQLWKVRPDGTNAERVLDSPLASADLMQDESPTGDRLVFVRDPYFDGNPTQLVVLTLATGQVVPLGVPGQRPRWSPDGNLIAFTDDGAVKVVEPGGSGLRTLTTSGSWVFGLDWTPDGQWIVAARTDGLAYINVASGLVLPLAFEPRLRSPVWKP